MTEITSSGEAEHQVLERVRSRKIGYAYVATTVEYGRAGAARRGRPSSAVVIVKALDQHGEDDDREQHAREQVLHL